MGYCLRFAPGSPVPEPGRHDSSRVGYTVERREIGMAFVAAVAARLALLLARLGAALGWSGPVL